MRQDLSKISCDLHLYEVYTKGFIEGCAGALTELELDMLPMGAILMTLNAECVSLLIIWREIIT